MTLRSIFVSASVACIALLSTSVQAHDPSLHEPAAKPAKATPVNCVQLEDTARYSNDLTVPDIKALKTKCDAEKSAAAKKLAASKSK